MTKFRPCIDLHEGRVKQIVGGTLSDADDSALRTNFESEHPASYFATLYEEDELKGGHVIKLGPGNDDAAEEALAGYPDGLQIGGGINLKNAERWLECGASHVIVTSFLFDGAHLDEGRLKELSRLIGRENLVVDLSCRRKGDGWVVATDRWQTLTDFPIEVGSLDSVAEFCDELLIHAADVEGMCGGIDGELVSMLGSWGRLPMTYAGGARSITDLKEVDVLSEGKVDLTIGSALDLFGGDLVRYSDCVEWNLGG